MRGINKLVLFFIIGIFGIVFYFIIFQTFFDQLYCQKQIDLKVYSFRQAVKKNGADEKLEENDEIKRFLVELYKDCLKPDGSE